MESSGSPTPSAVVHPSISGSSDTHDRPGTAGQDQTLEMDEFSWRSQRTEKCSEEEKDEEADGAEAAHSMKRMRSRMKIKQPQHRSQRSITAADDSESMEQRGTDVDSALESQGQRCHPQLTLQEITDGQRLGSLSLFQPDRAKHCGVMLASSDFPELDGRKPQLSASLPVCERESLERHGGKKFGFRQRERGHRVLTVGREVVFRLLPTTGFSAQFQVQSSSPDDHRGKPARAKESELTGKCTRVYNQNMAAYKFCLPHQVEDDKQMKLWPEYECLFIASCRTTY
ncbi:unnamed protein product [Pleuronectes platessa]|uniref:Uncharacterized protein n=1 Tax=Pleuronectes platessa TaxID=8262 RepID=A0A9N7Y3S5_PLEPL|nr:unnamed protein product [Pleuronectes platessa]